LWYGEIYRKFIPDLEERVLFEGQRLLIAYALYALPERGRKGSSSHELECLGVLFGLEKFEVMQNTVSFFFLEKDDQTPHDY
jgi:hypothetical protein